MAKSKYVMSLVIVSAVVFGIFADNNVVSGGTVIFEDNFDGPSSIPDTTKWNLCRRSHPTWARFLSESYDQAYVSNGCLVLKAELVDGQYKTGAIETRGKFDFCYGTVECRARFVRRPHGNHTGIWMMPAPPAARWPIAGEIDIMEHLGDEWKVYQTLHSYYIDDMGYRRDPQGNDVAQIDPEQWNVYGVTWTPQQIVFTVNGTPQLSYPNLNLGGEEGALQWPFDRPFYLILSQSLGGEGTWAGAIDDAALPAIFEIDWIRVTQNEN